MVHIEMIIFNVAAFVDNSSLKHDRIKRIIWEAFPDMINF